MFLLNLFNTYWYLYSPLLMNLGIHYRVQKKKQVFISALARFGLVYIHTLFY